MFKGYLYYFSSESMYSILKVYNEKQRQEIKLDYTNINDIFIPNQVKNNNPKKAQNSKVKINK
jgi:hypothetical protein